VRPGQEDNHSFPSISEVKNARNRSFSLPNSFHGVMLNYTQSIIAVNNKHTAKLHHVGSLCIYILTYDARRIKHKIHTELFEIPV
jgi:hypothetical protein